MEILEVAGSSYPQAHELPLKYRYTHPASAGKYKSTSGNSGTGKKNRTQRPSIPLGILAQEQKTAQEQTRANQKVLVLGGGKRRWIRVGTGATG